MEINSLSWKEFAAFGTRGTMHQQTGKPRIMIKKTASFDVGQKEELVFRQSFRRLVTAYNVRTSLT